MSRRALAPVNFARIGASALRLIFSTQVHCPDNALGQHFADDVAMHVGQSEVAAGEVIRQTLVI